VPNLTKQIHLLFIDIIYNNFYLDVFTTVVLVFLD